MFRKFAHSLSIGVFASGAILGAILGASGVASATPPPPPCPGDSPWSLAEPPPPVRIDLSVVCPSPVAEIPPAYHLPPKWVPPYQIPGGGPLRP